MVLDIASVFSVTDLTTVLVFIVVVLAFFLYWSAQLPANFPPGPRPWPIVGTLPFTAKHFSTFHKTTLELVKKYGPIIGFKMGKYPAIVLADYDVITEALVRKSDSFSYRPDFLYIIKRVLCIDNEVRGIIMRSGDTWKNLRRFSLTSMRDLGVGKRSIEERIRQEANFLCQELSKEVDNPYNIENLTHKAVSNIICQVCFGERYDHNDPAFNYLLSKLKAIFETNTFGSVINYIPILRFAPFSKWYVDILECSDKIDKFVDGQIKSHRETFDSANIRDFIDLYLLNENTKQDGKLMYNQFDVYRAITDLFVAGTDTTTTTLRWLLLYMIRYPDVQTKCQQEIDLVIGSNQTPAISDRSNLPYVEATIHEVQRLGNIAVFAVPHATKCDTTLGKYKIPKNTMVLVNLYSVHMDPNLWERPEEFQPERWIGENGKFTRRDGFIPFSIGPRVCPGESLAKTEMFLFFTALLQRFRFRMSDPGNPPSLEGQQGITFAPSPYDLIAQHR